MGGCSVGMSTIAIAPHFPVFSLTAPKATSMSFSVIPFRSKITGMSEKYGSAARRAAMSSWSSTIGSRMSASLMTSVVLASSRVTCAGIQPLHVGADVALNACADQFGVWQHSLIGRLVDRMLEPEHHLELDLPLPIEAFLAFDGPRSENRLRIADERRLSSEHDECELARCP